MSLVRGQGPKVFSEASSGLLSWQPTHGADWKVVQAFDQQELEPEGSNINDI